MNEIKEKLYLWLPALYKYAYHIAFVLLALLCFYIYRADRVHTDTSTTISTINQQLTSSGSEIHSAIRENQSAGNAIVGTDKAIDRAIERTERSKELISDSKQQLAEIKRIVDECKTIARQNRNILESVRTTDRPNP